MNRWMLVWALLAATLVACEVDKVPPDLPIPGKPGDGQIPVVDPPKPPDPPPDPVTPTAEFSLPPLQTALQHYELTLDPADVERMNEQDRLRPWEAAIEVDGSFKAEGVTYPVRLRHRGASSRSEFDKKSWNVDLGELRFEGRDDLNLIAEFQDQTLMVEKLAYDLLRGMGTKVPQGKYVALWVNGTYQGTYLDLEQVDGRFVKMHGFADRDATLFRMPWKNSEVKLRNPDPWGNEWRAGYQLNNGWVQKTNERKFDASPLLDEFLWAVNRTPDPTFPAVLEARLELDHLLRTLAIDALMSNFYVEDSESYFLHDAVTGKWTYVPWDLNNADARWWPSYGIQAEPIFNHPVMNYSLLDGWVQRLYDDRKKPERGAFYLLRDQPAELDGRTDPVLPNFSNLNTRIFLNPELRERALRMIEQTIAEVFNPEVLHPRIDAMYALIEPYQLNQPGDANPLFDPYLIAPYQGVTPGVEKFKRGPWYLKRFIEQRVAFVKDEITRIRAMKPRLAITAFDPNANWVELTNRTPEPIGLEGVVVTKNLRRPFEVIETVNAGQPDETTRNFSAGTNKALAPQTLAPGATVRLSLAELGITLDPAGELGLFRGPSVVGFLDAVFYGEVQVGQRYERESGGTGWRIRE